MQYLKTMPKNKKIKRATLPSGDANKNCTKSSTWKNKDFTWILLEREASNCVLYSFYKL